MLKWSLPDENGPVHISKQLIWVIVAICLGAFLLVLLSWYNLFSLVMRHSQTLAAWCR